MLPASGGDDLGIELAPALSPGPIQRARPCEMANAALLVGREASRGPAVYLHVSAIEAMFADVLTHGRDETGGILSGGLCQDSDGQYVRVDGAVTAPDARRSETRVTFSHNSWSAMLSDREARFPGQSVIGWYHSHPGMPVILSDTDRFVHRAFFSRPQDIAVVIDLHRAQWAVFGWHGEEIILLEGFRVFADSPGDGAGLEPILRRFLPRTGA